MKKYLLALLLGSTLGCAFAAPASTQEIDFLKKINKLYPKLEFNDAVFLPQVGLYELHKKGSPNLTYTNSNLDYLYVNGEVLDIKHQENISTSRLAVNVNRFFAELPTEQSIPVKFGKGTVKVAIFTDPDCPYCKQLDKEIHANLKNDDFTIYYYMNPLKISGHELAPLEAKRIWCANDKSAAWVDWMLNSKLPNNNGTCKNPVDENKALATSVGFNSTPTIIFSNGYVIKGGVDIKTFKEVSQRKPIAEGIR
jgi:thiol:disulfide interchange protein DsbC